MFFKCYLGGKIILFILHLIVKYIEYNILCNPIVFITKIEIVLVYMYIYMYRFPIDSYYYAFRGMCMYMEY